ncbi:MAG TPA: transposase [archaeon]|nr:transposase [archaeon]
MYRGKNRQKIPLFPELFPFGGKLNPKNRWLQIARLIPWEKIESRYERHFSKRGRPALDGRLVIGILLLKHMTGFSYESIIEMVNENPYMQAFCGLDHFVTKPLLDASSLSKIRKRFGPEDFDELERETLQVLLEHDILKEKSLHEEPVAFPKNVQYPEGEGMLNESRQWVVRKIKSLGSSLGGKVKPPSPKE